MIEVVVKDFDNGLVEVEQGECVFCMIMGKRPKTIVMGEGNFMDALQFMGRTAGRVVDEMSAKLEKGDPVVMSLAARNVFMRHFLINEDEYIDDEINDNNREADIIPGATKEQ